jgi:membrane fusion protein, copper/silver efflux system
MKLSPLLLTVLALAAGWCASLAFHGDKAGAVTAAASGDLQCPMHPWIKSAHPGTCTVCGMALVPMAGGDVLSENAEAVMLPPASVRVTGVQTATVKRAPLMRTLRFAGRFEEDASAHAIISAPVEGRIDGLGLVHGNGKIVQRQPLATFFSATLLAVAKEYKDALNHDEAATAAAKKKLEHYGLVWEQIQSIPLRQDNDIYFGILSPRSGSVVKSYCSEGQYVREGERLFEITDLTKLWFMFSVFEQDLPLIKTGQTVAIETSTLPPEKITAQITFIEKNLDETTHSVHVRVDVANPKGQLRLNGDGICTVNLEAPEVLAVPRSAVLWPGDAPRVFVEAQNGTYERRTVKLGHSGDCDWEVLAGLSEGEHVVTEAAMLIDGQAQLKVSQ